MAAGHLQSLGLIFTWAAGFRHQVWWGFRSETLKSEWGIERHVSFPRYTDLSYRLSEICIARRVAAFVSSGNLHFLAPDHSLRLPIISVLACQRRLWFPAIRSSAEF